jgi:DnaJ homolog subfamily C member 28
MRLQALFNALWQLSVSGQILIKLYQPWASYTSKASSTQNASTKLFADAQREERESEQHVEPTTSTHLSQLPFLERQHENWTRDESIQDLVLCMLVDKYKPLWTGSIQSAD